MMKFNEKYNLDSFLQFLQDFLPIDFAEKEEDIIINKDRYKKITTAKVLGYCESLDLYVLEMDHTHEKDPRVTIATDAFKIIADHWIHKALIVFKNKESDNYRLSYLTISLDLNDKNKAVKKYSNARRYSFYLGVNAKIKTPEQQLIKKGKVKDADDLLSRFSVEVVNKQFYLEVARYFDDVVSKMKLPSVSDENINIKKSFAVRLIGRIMFCWFLKQKKSPSGQLIPDEILSSKVVVDNYYHNVLEPLFFGVLNTSIESRDIRNDLFDKVPYLNGGLFNPQSDDFYELDRETFVSKFVNTLKINDEWFKIFFELLETYNFTIDENTVFDQELSVDPEMLGRIFENLLAEINPETGSSERKRTGSFYTPRQIVEYMVDQSLIEYLKTKTSVDSKKLSALASYDLTDDEEYPLTDEEKKEITNAIESLKILDPACGSGAFPMGALQKIVYMLQQIDPDCKLWLESKLKGVPELYKQKIINEVKSNPFDYTRKLDVIKNSIFGVDIQPIAVDVSRLRCFLTLVVEAEIDDTKQNRGIEPLPNLDFKFVCANTLIPSPDHEFDEIGDRLFNDPFQARFTAAVDRYFSSSGINKINAGTEVHKLIDEKIDVKLRYINNLVSYSGDEKIEAMRAELNKKEINDHAKILDLWKSYKNIFENKPVGFFEIRYFFPSVKDGFDIVIGNPPYGFRNVLSADEKKYFRKIEKIEFSSGDSAELFCRKCFDNLVKKNGILSFIIPKKSLYGDAWEGFRRKYWLKYNLKFLLDSSKAFENVLLEANAFCLIKNDEVSDVDCLYLDKDDSVVKIGRGKKNEIFLENSTAQVYLLKIPKTFWNKININKIEEDFVVGKLGLAIGTDFFSNTETEYKLLKGIDIGRWRVKSNRWLKNEQKLNWKSAKDFLKPKIIAQRLVAHIENPTPHIKITACYDREGIIITNTLMSFDLNSKILPEFWLAYLNSSFVGWYSYNFIYARAIRGMDLYNFYIQQIPIPKAILEQGSQDKFIEMVTQIEKIVSSVDYKIDLKKHDIVKEFERKIDELVMDLYGLNEEEKEIIRNS